jgi:hypothetical protein
VRVCKKGREQETERSASRTESACHGVGGGIAQPLCVSTSPSSSSPSHRQHAVAAPCKDFLRLAPDRQNDNDCERKEHAVRSRTSLPLLLLLLLPLFLSCLDRIAAQPSSLSANHGGAVSAPIETNRKLRLEEGLANSSTLPERDWRGKSSLSESLFPSRTMESSIPALHRRLKPVGATVSTKRRREGGGDEGGKRGRAAVRTAAKAAYDERGPAGRSRDGNDRLELVKVRKEGRKTTTS